MMMDGMVGPDYEKGLARLKAAAETPPATGRRRRIDHAQGRQSIADMARLPRRPGQSQSRMRRVGCEVEAASSATWV